MEAVTASPPPKLRAVPLLAGMALVSIYIRIGDVLGYQASYGPPWFVRREGPSPFTYASSGELRLWLAHIALAVPAAILLAWGAAPRLGPPLVRLLARIDHASPRAWRWAALAMFVGLVAWSVLGRHFVMLDEPLTDDENAVTFGARMIAEGRLRVPILEPQGAFTDLFLYQRAGMVSAMDFPGVLFFGAAAIVTGLGSVLYAIASAASGIATAYAAGRWFGARARVIAAAIWIASPMIGSLSLTSHGHIPSRLFVSLALAFAARLDTDAGTPRRDALLLGLCGGLGFLCRPFEVTCLLAPLGLWLGWRMRARSLWIVAGMLPGIVCFAIYNAIITGVWYLQARFAPGALGGMADQQSPWDRLGFHIGWNLLMLAVFFLGIPAIAAVIAGLDRRPRILLVLALGVLANLALCLLHDNTGIHSVGPIHLSEVAVLLVVIATAGMLRTAGWFASARVERGTIATIFASYLVIAVGALDLSNLASLRVQANSRTYPARMIEQLGIHHAVVVARPFAELPQIDPSFAPWGTWELQFPHPDPFLRDDVIFVRPDVRPEVLRARFPDRAFYAMTYHVERPSLRIAPITP